MPEDETIAMQRSNTLLAEITRELRREAALARSCHWWNIALMLAALLASAAAAIYGLTKQASAEITGFSPGTLRRWRCEHRGPPWVQVTSRNVRYRPEDIAKYIEARVRRPPDPPPAKY